MEIAQSRSFCDHLGKMNSKLQMKGLCLLLVCVGGSDDSMKEWLSPKIDTWVSHIRLLARVAKRYPHTAFAALSKSLQCEWTYLQRVLPDISDYFAPIEQALQSEFIPALFGDEQAPPRSLSKLPVRYAGLGIPDPVSNSDHHFNLSLQMIACLLYTSPSPRDS